MNLVTQETPHGCGVAALAMVLGVDYDTAMTRLGRDVEEPYGGREPPLNFLGVTCPEITRVLREHEIASLLWYPRSAYRGVISDAWEMLRMPSVALLEDWTSSGRTAILAVPSKNMEGAGHLMVYHDCHVYDPACHENKYTELPIYSEIWEAVLVGDR